MLLILEFSPKIEKDILIKPWYSLNKNVPWFSFRIAWLFFGLCFENIDYDEKTKYFDKYGVTWKNSE